MKRILFSAMAAIGLSLFSNNVDARSWRINSKPEAKANFLSIEKATSSSDVLNGDTLYLDPGCLLTSSQQVRKSVTIIGTGYNLKNVTEETLINLHITSSNVKIEGCYLNSLYIYGGKGISNIVIERCKVVGSINLGDSYTTINNIKINSCYISGELIHERGTVLDVDISNCIIKGRIDNFSYSTFTNNTILCSKKGALLTNIQNSKISNNIILNTSTEYATDGDQQTDSYSNYTIANVSVSDNNTITNTVLSTDASHAFADHPDNKFIGAKPEDVFTMQGTEEERYRLKADSPAKGYGYNGCDCGAYDGMFPYVVSGHPHFLPYVENAVVSDRPIDGKINVKLKIKVQNE